MSGEYIKQGTIDLPGEPLSPVGVLFEVPAGCSAPSDVQLRRFASVRAEFASLWGLAMLELQRFFDERTDNRGLARQGIKEAAIAIHEPNAEESDEDFFWNLVFVVREDVPEQYWEIHFTGLRFEMVLLLP